MGVFPCAVGSHRYGGRQQMAYLSIVNGSVSNRERLRLCGHHFMNLVEWLESNTQLIAIGEITQIDDKDPLTTCCDQYGVGDRFTAYAKVYPTGEDPREYCALLCAYHVLLFAERAQIAL
jgi:hypothetical protein